MKKIGLLLFLYLPFSYAMDRESLKEELFKAAHEGNVEKIKDLITNKEVKVNARNLAGDTALIIAVKNKKIEAVKELLELAAKIDRPNSNGQTALTLAIEAKNLEMVKTLLHENADINQKYADKTPLMLAIETKDIGIITEILNQVPDKLSISEAKDFTTKNKSLDNATITKIVELLEKARNQYNLYELIKTKKSDSAIADIKDFIKDNQIISLNVKNGDRNPLIAAIINTNNLELVNFLIAKGANVNQILTFGVTPLLGAIMNMKFGEPNMQIITTLLQNGADQNIGFSRENSTVTPLMVAIARPMTESAKLELVKLLVRYKAKINDLIRFKGQNITPLNMAILGNNTQLVKELLDAGADSSLKNPHGQAVDIAQKALDEITKKLAKATSENNENKKKYYAKEKENYENIIKLLNAKKEEIAKKTSTMPTGNKSLLSALQKFTQSLKVLQQYIVKKQL